ncbi:uncharacterized protein LOC116696505 [Etheostoma spectabile]|uniref:G-protein coupled receptors family 1 profile domain-containing protein n=1 Tax=Etheostoma spectabile TaxID=54343 RepID=A0A5J5D6E3_9PERO|nr:uncharacterized protein LOC116696505 [Etheostoma spectabile]KAA8588530.1 hypothetical protein FQN60_009875 [Etheostoma spectabile]
MEGKLPAHIQVKQDNEFQSQLPFNTQIKPKTVWEMVWSWPGSAPEGVLSASRGWLRLFLLLKLVTVLLFPHTAGLPLLVGCVFSLRALLLLRSPNISTKPSTVLLGRLALTDSLVLLHWMLLPGAPLVWWMEEAGWETKTGLMELGESVWWNKAVSMLCLQLLDAHHLASLLLLGLLGLEATLVSRWPQQTRRFRTSHWAQLSCSLVWTLVLLELLYSLHSQLLQKSRPQTNFTTLQISQSSPLGLVPLPSLPGFSSCLRRTLWLVNLWLHYAVFHSRSKKTKSFFH